MSVVITNISPLDLPDDQPHEYIVRINNQPVIARFRHRRDEGLAICLKRAADAVERAAIAKARANTGVVDE